MSNVNYKSDQVFLYWDDISFTNSNDSGNANTNSEKERNKK
jgi:hypothetical protein